MLIVELDKLAFCTRLVIGDHYLWHFGILRGGRDPDGTRTSMDKIYWYSAERAVGHFPIRKARLSFLFDTNGMITLTEKSKALVWVNEQLLELSQSVIDFLLNPENAMKCIEGEMLRFRTQSEYFALQALRKGTSPQNSSANDLLSAPTLTGQA